MRAASLYGLCGFVRLPALEYYGLAACAGNVAALDAARPMIEGFANLPAKRVWRDRYRQAVRGVAERGIGRNLSPMRPAGTPRPPPQGGTGPGGLTRAHRGGVKGITVHRPGRAMGDVVVAGCGTRRSCGPSCESG